ncbi:Conserved oligomeric Golgi complex subunit 6 [Porphyridium purpureum]|uniref:Conserved oligomeric Golgi complex subunit 6 n=1 Tax=Porphyridium purpureum TaxID=35688 RepID=A0A5J4YXW2_PORPP|nr:Conserved oligomeric Golgi complex subunit 6 [Porphyridium purpureum]|eukprot:POR0964..scf208_2
MEPQTAGMVPQGEARAVASTESGWAVVKAREVMQSMALVDSPGVLTALQEIQQFVNVNSREARLSLKSELERRAIHCSADMMLSFFSTQQTLQRLHAEIGNMQQEIDQISSRLSDARLGASMVVKQTMEIKDKLHESRLQASVAERFSAAFLLNDEEERALEGVVTPAFLNALRRLEEIHENARILLRNHNQRTGLEILEMAAAKREDAYEKLYRFVHAQCGPVDVDNNDNDEEASHLLRESIRLLRARPVLLKYCADEVGAARRAILVERFVAALTKGGPGGIPKPIELQAHDILRYTNDMLAWVHQALASERELMRRLFGSDHEDFDHSSRSIATAAESNRGGEDGADEGERTQTFSKSLEEKDGTVPSPSDDLQPAGTTDGQDERSGPLTLQNSDSEMLKGSNLAMRVLNTTFDALCRPFRVRYEQALEPLPPVVTLYKLASLLEFYANMMRSLLGENAAFPDMLLECNTVAMYAFFSTWKSKMDEFRNSGVRVADDLSPPMAVLQSMSRLAEIMNTLESSLAPAEERESQIHAVVEVILIPLEMMCQQMSKKSLPPIEQNIFLANCLDALRQPLQPHAFAAARVEKLIEQADEYIDAYTQLATAAILRRCGLVDRLRQLSSRAEDVPLACVPGMDLESLSISMKNFYSLVFGGGAVGLMALAPPKVNLVQNVRMRNRAKVSVAELLSEAHAALYNAVIDPKNEYGPDAAAAVGLRTPDMVSLVLQGQV